MSPKTPKYFHYFLACLIFDLSWVFSIVYLAGIKDQIYFFVIAWFIANFIHYPRLISRRYISYYNLIALSFRQLLSFYLLYGLYFAFLSDRLIPIHPSETWPIFSIIIARIVFVAVLRIYRKQGRGYNRFIIIGNTPMMLQLKDRFLQKQSYGFIHEGTINKFDLETIQELILNRKLNEIYCSSAHVSQEEISRLLSFTLQYGTAIHVVTDDEAHPEEASINAIPLDFGQPRMDHYPLMDQKNLLVKRIFDLFFSALVILLVLSWFTLILGILIKIDSRGPIFFKQPRAGRNGRYFTCLKFRSMKVSAGHQQAQKNDPRVTRIGRFIRKTSLDELPQFINVFLGQMSVVGPRPHVKQLNDRYNQEIEQYNDRILIKPGITGLSQIKGYRGETKGTASMKERIQTDILYMRNWSMYLDIVIIYKTILDILRNKSENAY